MQRSGGNHRRRVAFTSSGRQKFAKEYGISRAYGSYADLAADQDIDIIYVATPHPAHFECAMLCLKAGKAVLCEKPFTLNASETKVLIKTARACEIIFNGSNVDAISARHRKSQGTAGSKRDRGNKDG